MEPEFWRARWARNDIGFHQEDVNTFLIDWWSKIAPREGTVLVPLCGKSRDMLWLRAQGLRVIGVEVSELAVQAFFADNTLAPTRTARGGFGVWEVDGLALWCGDFFALRPEWLEGVTAYYDRAALIALPPALRGAYVEHLATLLPRGARGLLVTLEYDQIEMEGPPFSVPRVEVEQRFAPHFSLTHLQSRDKLVGESRYKQKGLTALTEKAYAVEKLKGGSLPLSRVT